MNVKLHKAILPAFRFLRNQGLPITANDRKIRRLKNIHRGKRAFIIGNGPSLKMSDLDRLSNEITFASNKIFLAFENTAWRPAYHMIEDPIVLKTTADLLPDFHHQLFLSAEILRYAQRLPSAIYYHVDWKTDHYHPEFILHPFSRVYAGFSVLYSCFQFAHYMGIETVYLLGVDQSYKPAAKIVEFAPAAKEVNQGKGTPVYEAGGEINHFHKDYYKPGEIWLDPNIEFQRAGFAAAREVFERSGRKIYNATRGGNLDVFPRVDFDGLFG